MIRRCWKNPNFRARVRDRDGQEEAFLCYAETEAELQDRLIARGLDVLTIQQYEFKKWRDRARAARRKAMAEARAGKRPIKFDEKIWRELKLHLFDLFYGKCAYCEGKPLAVSSGDVEHYRPKQKVDEDPSHPGYYWLAYSPSNLLPSCERCNRTSGGKMTHFPVAGFRAAKPSEVKLEDPLLLNPYDPRPELEPSRHLDFNEFGTVAGNTEFGEASREHYHLNRSPLPDERRGAQALVEQDWDVATIKVGFIKGYDDLENELRLGQRVYSAAQLAQLNRLKAKRIQFLASRND